jgi:hypothetical protein
MPTTTPVTGRPLAWKMTPTLSPFFSELHIPKGFKCCVLKLRILQGLQARFAEVHTAKDLGMGRAGGRAEEKNGSEDPPLQKRGKSRGAEAPHLQRRREGAPRERKAVGGEDHWLDREQDIGNGSMGLAMR